MFTRGIIAASILAAGLALLPGAASAKTNLYIGVGPGWGHGCYDYPFGDCGYRNRYRPHRYYYDDYDYDYDYDDFDRSRISCSEAKEIVRDSGYRNVKTVDCGGKSHTFKARKRDHSYRLRVSARSGRVTVISRY